ncbi:MAG: hypothetical protein JO112_12900 [Planctomycetes bacterium]|nr:hypothetical protein [Planctomycetota bacterium]
MIRTRALVLGTLVACLGWAVPAWAQQVVYRETGAEFVGPFPSWKNVQTDYGVRGDGVADDTAAIQKGLDDLKNVANNDWCVLYFPAGSTA